MDAVERQNVGAVLAARVSAADQQADLDRPVALLATVAAEPGIPVTRRASEVGSGLKTGPAKGFLACWALGSMAGLGSTTATAGRDAARNPSRRRWPHRGGA